MDRQRKEPATGEVLVLNQVVIDREADWNSIPPGTFVVVTYKDHALYRNVEPRKAQPIIRKVFGRLDRQDPESLYLVVDEYDEPTAGDLPVRKATIFAIVKSTLLELRPLSTVEGKDA